ncbi:MAG: DUF4349 domain-containing protein, partial [Planctomycetaceae bacterium]|nr:DUF4349 domain-containing protein [Planctomycetaceae bacterium]
GLTVLAEVQSTAAESALPDPSATSAIAAATGRASTENNGSQRIQQRIVYTAQISIVVESFTEAASRVAELANQAGGYPAASEESGNTGSQRTGRWTIRVPVSSYTSFLDAVSQLGEVVSRAETSREVTAEYYDIDARVRNKLQEEERLRSILEERTAKLDDILSVEKEISRVRGEVEQLQARLRVLNDLTAFSTVTLFVSERHNYIPAAAPDFPTRIMHTWQATCERLTHAAQYMVLTSVAVGPWLIVMGALFLMSLPIRNAVRRFRRTLASAYSSRD